mgnify:CR=1 FL=1
MKPIYVNHQHEILIESYINTLYDSIRNLVNDTDKVDDFMDIVKVIFEYHNEYGKDRNASNYHDFLMIIPLNVSVMTTGFLCGLETTGNASTIRVHRELLGQYSLSVIDKIKKIEPVHE